MNPPSFPVVEVVRLRRGREPLPLPDYMTAGAAGMDLRADLDADLVLAAGQRRLVPTGLRLAIPAGFEGQVRPRSGLAAREGLTLLNAPGTIDADYRGELMVLLINLGNASVRLRRGDRIAQLVIAPVARVTWQEVGELAPSTRGEGGFGSSDKIRGAPSGARPMRGLRSNAGAASAAPPPNPPRRTRQSRVRLHPPPAAGRRP